MLLIMVNMVSDIRSLEKGIRPTIRNVPNGDALLVVIVPVLVANAIKAAQTSEISAVDHFTEQSTIKMVATLCL